jgi:hypothetical protein
MQAGIARMAYINSITTTTATTPTVAASTTLTLPNVMTDEAYQEFFDQVTTFDHEQGAGDDDDTDLVMDEILTQDHTDVKYACDNDLCSETVWLPNMLCLNCAFPNVYQ